MRILIDAICPGCGASHVDTWIDNVSLEFPVCACGVRLTRDRHYAPANAVKADSIPGGMLFEHGLCHADSTPRRFDSWTEVRKAEKAKGLENCVEHIPDRGSDKSRQTQRFL